MANKKNCTKNGVQYFRLSATVGTKPDGRPERKDFYGINEKDAKRRRDEYLEAHKNKGISAKYLDMNIADLMHIWLFEVRLPSDNAPSTFTRYEGTYRKYIKDSELGKLTLLAVSKLALQRFYNQLIVDGKSTSTVFNVNKILKVFFSYTVDNDLLNKNPCHKIKLPVSKPNGIDENITDEVMINARPLSNEEITVIKKNLINADIELLFLLSLGTGIRQGEALALTFRDVENTQVKITKSLSQSYIYESNGKRTYKTIVKPPKTKNSRRVVAIPDGLNVSLARHISFQKEKYLRNGIPFDESLPLFTTDSCKYIDRRNLLRAWERLLARSGIEYRKWHIIRKTYATKLFEANVPLKTVQTLMGHSSILITEQIYVSVMPAVKEAAVNELNYLFD